MSHTFTLCLVCCLWCAQAVAQKEDITAPQYSLLLKEVQMQRVFTDSKTFVDAEPLRPLDVIYKEFKDSYKKKKFDLAAFVRANFNIPEASANAYQSDPSIPIEAHIEKLWEVLEKPAIESKGTLIGLPNAYIVPGGRFREIYYWDTYFTMLGLVQSGRVAQARNMLDNFSHLIDEHGFVPNGNRTYYLSRSQPPFYSLMVNLLSQYDSATEMPDFIPYMEKEYAFWMDGRDSLSMINTAVKRVVRLSNGSVLNRYWDSETKPRPEAYWVDTQAAKQSFNDPENHFTHVRAACESGWDFSSRWMGYEHNMEGINTTDIVPIDLNCLLYLLERNLADAYQQGGLTEMAEHYNNLAEDRERAILTYCWSEDDGFFQDFSHIDGGHTGILSLAGVFPLFAGICTQDQAFSVSEKLEEQFLAEGGLLCTLLETGQQWDAPNGWAPLHWIAISGLDRYGLDALASDISDRWTSTVENYYQKNGKILEKYNVKSPMSPPTGGEYSSQDGFGWTNGVYVALKKK